MEKYREDIVGNKIDGTNTEELKSGRTNIHTNAPLALIEISVQAQICLLQRLHQKGMIK